MVLPLMGASPVNIEAPFPSPFHLYDEASEAELEKGAHSCARAHI